MTIFAVKPSMSWGLDPADYWDESKFDADAYIKGVKVSNLATKEWIKGMREEMSASALKCQRMRIHV